MGKIKYTFEEVKELVNNLGYELISKEYNYKVKIIFKDKEGYYYNCKLGDLLKNKTAKIFFPSNPYTIHNIKLWVETNQKPFILVSKEYINAHKDLKWKCLKEGCGEEFGSNWNHINNNRGCPFCDGRQVGISNCLATKNPELTKEWHPTLNGDLTPYDVTIGYDKDIWWQCPNNQDHKWQAKIYARHVNKSGCPYCSGRLPTKENNLLVCNPDLCKEWDYEKNKKDPKEYCPNANQYVWWKCPKCNHNWYAIISSRNGAGRGCPQCNESKGEKELDKILTKYNIPHDSQYKFNNLRGVGGKRLKFDVPIFWDKEKSILRMLIEYDGEFHYEDIFNKPEKFKRQQLNDQAKNTYCKNNNILLLRIPYWDFDKIEEILIRELNILVKKVV